jgi:hypothetical protein
VLKATRGRSMCLPGMATIANRFLTLCLVLAFIIGVTA